MESCIDSSKMIWNIIPVDLDGMNESMNTFNTKSENRANVVGQQLLLNLIKESNR